MKNSVEGRGDRLLLAVPVDLQLRGRRHAPEHHRRRHLGVVGVLAPGLLPALEQHLHAGRARRLLDARHACSPCAPSRGLTIFVSSGGRRARVAQLPASSSPRRPSARCGRASPCSRRCRAGSCTCATRGRAWSTRGARRSASSSSSEKPSSIDDQLQPPPSNFTGRTPRIPWMRLGRLGAARDAHDRDALVLDDGRATSPPKPSSLCTARGSAPAAIIIFVSVVVVMAAEGVALEDHRRAAEVAADDLDAGDAVDEVHRRDDRAHARRDVRVLPVRPGPAIIVGTISPRIAFSALPSR